MTLVRRTPPPPLPLMSMSFQQWDLISSAYNFRENHHGSSNLKISDNEEEGTKVGERDVLPVRRPCAGTRHAQSKNRILVVRSTLLRKNKTWKPRFSSLSNVTRNCQHLENEEDRSKTDKKRKDSINVTGRLEKSIKNFSRLADSPPLPPCSFLSRKEVLNGNS